MPNPTRKQNLTTLGNLFLSKPWKGCMSFRMKEEGTTFMWFHFLMVEDSMTFRRQQPHSHTQATNSTSCTMRNGVMMKNHKGSLSWIESCPIAWLPMLPKILGLHISIARIWKSEKITLVTITQASKKPAFGETNTSRTISTDWLTLEQRWILVISSEMNKASHPAFAAVLEREIINH